MEQPYPLSIMLTVRDVAKSVAFYRDMLGFTLAECWPDEKAPMWASMRLDRQAIMLGAQMSVEQATQMMAGDAAAAAYVATLAKELEQNRRGVGIVTYVMVADVDAYHAAVTKRGVAKLPAPKSQFYGLREFGLEDLDGFRFLFYTPIKMATCQSCGMPLQDAEPGQMYCQYCTDEKGHLRPYEQVLEGSTVGYFMQMQKLPRQAAEKAAREHLAKMPAWKSRGK